MGRSEDKDDVLILINNGKQREEAEIRFYGDPYVSAHNVINDRKLELTDTMLPIAFVMNQGTIAEQGHMIGE